jgi:hypothetical protein
MASVFYGNAAIGRGFAYSTLSGLALYVLLYSVLGAVFAMLVPQRLSRMRVTLLSILFGLCWYYTAFHLLAKAVAPLVALLHPERTTLVGHVIYGAVLARFPMYLPGAPGPPAAIVPALEIPATDLPVPRSSSGSDAPQQSAAAKEPPQVAPGEDPRVS